MSETFSGADFTAAAGESSSAAAESVATVDTSVPQGAATTEPTAGPAALTSSTDPAEPGPIPFKSHKTALDNARTKAIEDWRIQHGWAEHVDRQAVQQAQQIGELYTRDRAGFVRQMLADAANDPDLAPVVRSEAARLLGGGRAQAAPNLTPIAVQMEDGQTLGLYTADQIGALKEQWMDAMRKEMAPAMSAAEQIQQANRVAQANSFATGLTGEMATMPGFEDHKGEIGQEVRRLIAQYPPNDPRTDDPAFLETALFRAYNRVVVPKLDLASKRSVLHDINQKASASTVNPGAPSTSAPKDMKDMSWSEAFSHAFANQAR